MPTAQPLRSVCVRWWKRIRELWKLWADRRLRSMPAIVGRLQPAKSIANRWRNIWHPCRPRPLRAVLVHRLGMPMARRMRRQKRKRRQAKTQWTILRQHRLRMMLRMRRQASRMRLKAVQLPAECSLRHMTSYNILLSNPSFPIHCSHEVSGSRPRVLCRPRHRHG